jgi:VWFA-related protein
VTVYAIGFSGGFTRGSQRAMVSSSVLRSMTSLTGGALFVPQTSRDLPDIYARILKDLESQYVMGYVSDNHADGHFHKLKVTLKDRTLKVRHREGYVAPSPQSAER